MTNTLYQNIQTLGNRMVTNLTAKGVSAQFSDGGLTLADKILDINQFNDGVFLASDKKIGQSSNTVHLSAMVVDNGMFKVGEPISIEPKVNTTPIYTKTHINEDITNLDSIGDTIGSTSWALTFGTYSGSDDYPWIIIGNSSTFLIEKASNGFFFPQAGSNGVTLRGTILYYYNEVFWSNLGDVMDLSEWGDFYVYPPSPENYIGYLEGTVSFYKIYGGGVTGNSGAVSGIYSCSGAGLKEIVAKSGNLQSNTYEVTDCTFYDKGLSGTGNHNDNWTNNGNKFQIDRGSEYTTLTPTDSGSANRLITTSGAIPSVPFVVEFDKPVTTGNKTVMIFVLGNKAMYYSYYGIGEATHCKFQVNSDGTIYIWIDGERQSPNATYSNVDSIRFQVQGNNSADAIKFSNFKIYPI